MITYKEYKNLGYTLEIFQNPQETLVKLFYREEELLRLEYLTQTPIIVDCINNLIKMIHDDAYKYHKEDGPKREFLGTESSD